MTRRVVGLAGFSWPFYNARVPQRRKAVLRPSPKRAPKAQSKLAKRAVIHPLPGPAALDKARLLADAKTVIEAEGRAVAGLLAQLNGGFTEAARHILGCRGRVVVVGLGKSGVVGQKISATLASTGTPSLFLHAAEALHGDLGRITPEDVVLALSNSGESDEIVRLIKPVKSLGATLIVMTGTLDSTLARHADVVMHIGNVAEACPMGLVPTASTTAMLVLGDALAVALFNSRGFGRDEYARFHPGGQLGRKLLKVREVMRAGKENPVIVSTASVKEALGVMSDTPGRPGAVSVVDKAGMLVGFFTDGDIRRLLLNATFGAKQRMADVMHKNPKRVHEEQLVAEAVRILRDHKIDQVPVVDDAGRPVGFFDVQDLLSTRELEK